MTCLFEKPRLPALCPPAVGAEVAHETDGFAGRIVVATSSSPTPHDEAEAVEKQGRRQEDYVFPADAEAAQGLLL